MLLRARGMILKPCDVRIVGARKGGPVSERAVGIRWRCCAGIEPAFFRDVPVRERKRACLVVIESRKIFIKFVGRGIGSITGHVRNKVAPIDIVSSLVEEDEEFLRNAYLRIFR